MLLLGPPSAVRDLRATRDGISVTISWSPPFSLIPDIWYSVFIYNVTDENNPTAILCTNCTNITETHYTFTPDYLSPCHVYNFSVVPLNGAGQGDIAFGNILNCDFGMPTQMFYVTAESHKITLDCVLWLKFLKLALYILQL